MLLNKGANDEALILNSFAIKIRIAELIEHINEHSEEYKILECDTSILVGLNRTDYINYEVLEKMSNDRLEEPVLVTSIDEYEFVIDGNHRLQKRHQLGRDITKYIPINGYQLDPFVIALS